LLKPTSISPVRQQQLFGESNNKYNNINQRHHDNYHDYYHDYYHNDNQRKGDTNDSLFYDNYDNDNQLQPWQQTTHIQSLQTPPTQYKSNLLSRQVTKHNNYGKYTYYTFGNCIAIIIDNILQIISTIFNYIKSFFYVDSDEIHFNQYYNDDNYMQKKAINEKHDALYLNSKKNKQPIDARQQMRENLIFFSICLVFLGFIIAGFNQGNIFSDFSFFLFAVGVVIFVMAIVC